MNGVGISEYTSTKQKHFTTILGWHIAVTQAVLDRCNYYRPSYSYIDATAGPGRYRNEEGKIIEGSPLIFTRLAEKKSLSYSACLIEIDSENMDCLKTNIPTNGQIRFVCDDYAMAIPDLLNQPDDRQLGLFYLDPTGQLPNFESLHHVARTRQKMEMLLHISATTMKRVRCAFADKYTSLGDYLWSLGKKHWLVRKPYGKFQWTFLLGSNTDLFKDYKRIGFYRMESDDGKAIFDILDRTANERNGEAKEGQPTIPHLPGVS